MLICPFSLIEFWKTQYCAGGSKYQEHLEVGEIDSILSDNHWLALLRKQLNTHFTLWPTLFSLNQTFNLRDVFIICKRITLFNNACEKSHKSVMPLHSSSMNWNVCTKHV